jgi:hypothetical protein
MSRENLLIPMFPYFSKNSHLFNAQGDDAYIIAKITSTLLYIGSNTHHQKSTDHSKMKVTS